MGVPVCTVNNLLRTDRRGEGETAATKKEALFLKHSFSRLLLLTQAFSSLDF